VGMVSGTESRGHPLNYSIYLGKALSAAYKFTFTKLQIVGTLNSLRAHSLLGRARLVSCPPKTAIMLIIYRTESLPPDNGGLPP